MQTPLANLYEFGDFQLDTANGCCDAWMGPQFRSRRECSIRCYTWSSITTPCWIRSGSWRRSGRIPLSRRTTSPGDLETAAGFGETPGSHSYIVTVPGRGYRFVAEVNERPATRPTPEKAEAKEPIQR